jgi:hypothetical protein
VAPERLILPLPGVAVAVPPQLLVSPLEAETTRPAGRASVKPTPVTGTVLGLGLLITKDSVVLAPRAMEASPKESLIVGGEMPVTVRLAVFEVAPGPLWFDVIDPVVLFNVPAIFGVTCTEMKHSPPFSLACCTMLPPVSEMELVPDTAVTVPPQL